MNAKTAKLIRKFCSATKQPYERVKAMWVSSPVRFRKELRKALKLPEHYA